MEQDARNPLYYSTSFQRFHTFFGLRKELTIQ